MDTPVAGPAAHLTAQQLLNLGEDCARRTPVLTKYWPTIMGTFFGIGSAIFLNFQTRRPIFSGTSKLHNNNSGNNINIFFLAQQQ